MTASPIDVVQRQLDCYNQRQLDAFCDCFAEDAEIHELGAAAPTHAGKAAIRERYRHLFDLSPALNCHLVTRTALGRAVVDLEHITGRLGSTELFQILAIYEVEDGLIRRVHFVRP
jgi:hypothetical protein